MGEKLDKFCLLMWKNWLLQYRKPTQTIVEILAPVLLAIILVVIRSLVDPEWHEDRYFTNFCPVPSLDSNFSFICPPVNDTYKLRTFNLAEGSNGSIFSNTSLFYSPDNAELKRVMSVFNIAFERVEAKNDSKELESQFKIHALNTFAGVQFDDSYANITDLKDIKDFKVSIRFPGETRMKIEPFGKNTWKTNLVYPLFQTPGPRAPNRTTGADPGYYLEGFLALQHLLTMSLLLARDEVPNDIQNILRWFRQKKLPLLYMQRFPHAEWYDDMLLTVLSTMIGLIMMLSFVYTCISTVRMITTEKEKQLKETMKIMGLPNWLHWTSWFVKCFMFLFISICLMVILLKVRWYSNTQNTVFTRADPFVLLFFLTFYVAATITFCFALSVFFSKANTAATVAGLAWFLSYFPYFFEQGNYDDLCLSTKLFMCLGANSAMALGFRIVIMYEGTGEGIQWNNMLKSNSPDDSLTLGLVIMMLLIDTIIYLFIAIYVEAVFPGDYGVPLPWYFPFTANYWCGQPRYRGTEDNNLDDIRPDNSGCYEKEPQHLKVGVQIRNLKKVYDKKAAVRNLTLNMYEDQITVLLGHNGAGKTTTMSMLTGMITPTSGTAKINGHDIRYDMLGVRKSLGLCPQHNIIFDDLTVEEHLYFFSKLKGLDKKEIKAEIDKYTELLELKDKRKAKSSTLSGGMKRKLCVGIALCGKSRVVMLDEPTAGMDPSARRALWDLLQKQKEGRTMLLTTHFMDEADLLGDRIAIMAGGELQCCGSSFFLKKKYGAGYSLVIDKGSNCQVSKVTGVLRKYIPEIEVHSNVGSELTYLLTENQSAIFEPMLKELETESAGLGIRSYGISLTTLEEVFMKVGADYGQEEQYNTNGHVVENSNVIKMVPELEGQYLKPTYTSGPQLIGNQLTAMFLKKVKSIQRSWILLVIQVCMPVLFLIIAIVVTRNGQRIGHLPAMQLNLDKFTDPVSVVEKGNMGEVYYESYKKIMNEQKLRVEDSHIEADMIELTRKAPNVVRRRYIVGASFNSTTVPLFGKWPTITAWFNNDPYHSPGMAMSYALNAIYRKIANCEDCSVEYTNFPFPYSPETQVNQIISGQTMGFQLAFNIVFSMALTSSFYVLFPIRERTCKSKHLQFVSGVKVLVFWLTALVCDMLTYIFTIVILLITLVCFQEEGFRSADDIARMFLILICFGWAFLPMFYIAAYSFEVPSTGFTRMTLFGMFTGVAVFLVIQVLSTEGLGLEHVGNTMHWIFLAFPHYCLASAISDSYKTFSYNRICDMLFQNCARYGKDKEDCLRNMTEKIVNICSNIDDDYYKWKAPGIGRNLLYNCIVGAVLFLALLLIEYDIFPRLLYYLELKLHPRYPHDVPDEDSDVADEKRRIRNMTMTEMFSTYTMTVRDLTKYYKKFLAVNGLCLGVKKYECFGLLGVNGAGKTSTFKMMTGDVKMTCGDGWVVGYSIRDQMKKVQRVIGYCPQFDALLDDLTARETILMFSLLRGIRYLDAERVAEHLAVEFDFHRHLDKQVKELSGGNKRKLSTAVALIGDPPVLYLDEPTTGMDPATKRYLWNAICKIRDRGKCIVLTSHSMEECEALCTRIAIMVNGNFKCLGPTQHLKNKFSQGYTLTIKIKKDADTEARERNTAVVERFVKENFSTAQLREQHQELLTYYITDKRVPWSKMFGILERGKRGTPQIEDYSLGQSSLEQVFLTFTKHQS